MSNLVELVDPFRFGEFIDVLVTPKLHPPFVMSRASLGSDVLRICNSGRVVRSDFDRMVIDRQYQDQQGD